VRPEDLVGGFGLASTAAILLAGVSEQGAFGLDRSVERGALGGVLGTLGLGLSLGVQALADLLGVALVVEFEQPV